MRSDTNLSRRFQEEGVDARGYGAMPGVLDTSKEVDGQRVLRSHSFSGSERNSVFYNRRGEAFDDISGLSGIDSIADGRGFAFFDYDRDGRRDLVLTNTNNPQLQLFHNEVPGAGNAISVRAVGGGAGASNRDGVGAHILVEAGPLKLRREIRCGDGFAAQASNTLHIGIGDAAEASVTVLWPSGAKSTTARVPAGHRITLHEGGSPSPESARLETAARGAPASPAPAATLELALPPGIGPALIVNIATWCAVCRGEIPHLSRLSEAMPALRLFGLPADPTDTPEKLAAYQNDIDPPYQILVDNDTPSRRAAVGALLRERFGEEPLPCSILLGEDGAVLGVFKGSPTLSQLRRLTGR